MVKVSCSAKNCANKGVEYNIPGNPELVKCGGCHEMLQPEASDLPEPEIFNPVAAEMPNND